MRRLISGINIRRIGSMFGVAALTTVISQVILQLLIWPVLKNMLGTDVFGGLSLARSFVAPLIAFTSMGQSAAILRLAARYPQDQRSAFLVTGFWITVVLSTLAGAGLIAIVVMLPQCLPQGKGVSPAAMSVVVAISSLMIFFEAPNRITRTVLRVNLRIQLASCLEPIASVLMILAIPLTLVWGINGSAIGMALSSAGMVLVGVIACRQLGLLKPLLQWRWRDAFEIAKVAPFFQLAGGAITLSHSLSRWLLAYYISYEDVTYFFVADSFALMFLVPLDLFVQQVLQPLICAKGSLAELGPRRIFLFISGGVLFSFAVLVGGYFIGGPLMRVYGSDVVEMSLAPFAILLVGRSLDVFTILNRAMLTRFFPSWASAAVWVLFLAVNVTAGFLLVPKYGLSGAAYAAAIATVCNGLVNLVMLLVAFRRSRTASG